MGTRQVHIVDGVLSERTEKRSVAPRAAFKPAVKRSEKVSGSRVKIRDLFNEVLSGMFARPARMALTVLGIVVGLSALVATVGLTRTAGNRIISQFDQLAATELFVSGRPGSATGTIDPKAIPWDSPERIARLNGTVAVGQMSDVNVGDALVSSSPIRDPVNQSAFKLAVRAASPGMYRAVRAELAAGRLAR